MEAILPFKIQNEQKFFDSALKVGYNEMEILKFIYVMQQSDLDIFPIMHDERINMLLYGWELCEDYKQKLNPNEWELPEGMEIILKQLVPWSMDIWFSKEWDKCKYILKTALIHCLNRARDLLMRMPDMMQINWDFLLLYNLKPWNVLYLKNLAVTKDKTLEKGAQSIETEELPATDEDIAYVKLEQLPIIVLRLVKFFDQSSIDMVKTLCMRVIAAWNKIHQTELETSGSGRSYIPPEDKRCLLLICHIYLMAVYESDDVKGYVIDNMIHNIRFYYQGFQNSTPLHAMDNFEYTPARYIALTTFHLRVQKRDFFDFFIWNKYDTALVNLFGVVSQAYKSYLLGNLLMELNNMNEDDFAANIPLYKRLMNSYVNEREKSEEFLLNELTKLEHQRYAHNVIQTIKNISDFESKICKGNRMSNIGNYENSDDTVAPLADTKALDNDNNDDVIKEEIKAEVIDEDMELERVKESELRLDPVFQNLPNNESMLYYVYDVLAKKDYKGWHFAKVVLLVKLIGHEQNMIETWRYHPGLTTDFMLNLEVKLSHHYVDLAKIFKDHPFLEQEFWLTAFYLNPTPELYEIIKRLGMRNNRKRTDDQNKLVMSIDNIEAKYGLLSSTIDVKELATMSNTDDPVTDYEPLFSALHSLRVPDSLIKDMLTAIFLPRNRSFAWAVDWVLLRNRCKLIMMSSKEKKRFVDLNMAEANERLKYLIIDYEKYKNRPQLDYGTIEQGYESLMAGGEFDKDSTEEEEEEEEEEDFEDDEDVYESKNRGRGRMSAAARKKEEEEKVEDDNSQEDDPFLMGKRRTRARTAATLASFLFQTLPRSSRRKRNQKSEEDAKAEDEKISAVIDDRSSDSKSPITTSPNPSPFTGSCDKKETTSVNVPIKNLKECLKGRPTFLNTTAGFQDLVDIWNVEKTDLQSIDENCVFLMESSAALQIAVKLKLLNKEINPISCDDKEYIDEKEMIIHNAEYAIKKECELEEKETSPIIENTIPMDISDYAENAVRDRKEGPNVKSSFEQPSQANLKLPEETSKGKAARGANEDTNPECLKPPHETSNIKETKQKSSASQDLIQVEENSCESLNSDLSTAARKDSSEMSETNTEANSKRNSFNIDIEMVERPLQYDNVKEKNLKEASQEMDETLHCERGTTNIQGENCDESAKISDEKELNGKENKAKDCNADQHKRQAQKIAAKADKVGKETEVYGGAVNNQHKEIKTDDKNEKTKALFEYETESENNKRKENNADETKEDNKSNELIAESKDNTKEHDKSEQNNVETEKKSESSLSKIDETRAYTNDTKNIVKLQNKNSQIRNEYEMKTFDEATKNIITSTSKEDTLIDDLEKYISTDKESSYVDEMTIKNPANKLPDFEVNDVIKISIQKGETNRSLEKNAEIDDELFDVDSANRNETRKVEEAQESIGTLKDFSTEKTKQDVTELQTSESISKIMESGKERSKIPAKNNESTADLVEQKFNPQKDTEPKLNEDNASDSKISFDHSALHYSSIKQAANTDEEKPLSSYTIKSAEASEHQCDDTNNHPAQRIQSENATQALNNQTEMGTSYSTKTGDGSSNHQIVTDAKENTLFETIDAKNLVEVDDTSMHSVKSMEYDSTDSETRELKNLCLRKNVKVFVQRLRACDLTNLRQPKVKVSRTSYEKYLLEYRPKRRRLEERVYWAFDDSSNSNFSYGAHSSSSEAYRPPKIKRKIPVKKPSLRQSRTSDSDNGDSNDSDDIKLSVMISKKYKNCTSPSFTSRGSVVKRITGPKSARKRCPKSKRQTTGPKSAKQNLIVTPRSASGLKLRISNAELNRQSTATASSKRPDLIVPDEIIQLSSSSSSSGDDCVWNELTAIEEEIIEIDENALFEEEIII